MCSDCGATQEKLDALTHLIYERERLKQVEEERKAHLSDVEFVNQHQK